MLEPETVISNQDKKQEKKIKLLLGFKRNRKKSLN